LRSTLSIRPHCAMLWMRWSCPAMDSSSSTSSSSGFGTQRTPGSAQQACRQPGVVDCGPCQLLFRLLFLVFQMSFGHFTLMDISLCPPHPCPSAQQIAQWLPRNFCLPYWGCSSNSHIQMLQSWKAKPKPNPNTV